MAICYEQNLLFSHALATLGFRVSGLVARVGDAWTSIYRFDLQQQVQADYEILNYFLSTHPSSHFVTNLIVARPVADRRHALFNRRLTTHHGNGTSERRELANATELGAVLDTHFGLVMPAATLEDVWVRLEG